MVGMFRRAAAATPDATGVLAAAAPVRTAAALPAAWTRLDAAFLDGARV